MKMPLEDIRKLQKEIRPLDRTGVFDACEPEDFIPLCNKIVDWTLLRVKEHFELEERRGAKGYSAARPALILENLRSNKKTLRDLHLDSLKEEAEKNSSTLSGGDLESYLESYLSLKVCMQSPLLQGWSES